MRQPLIAAVMLVYVVGSSMVSVVSGQDTGANAKKAFEDAKGQHQSEVRRLALDAIGEIMPSLIRFTERQDFENLDKYIKMLALFSKSVDYPARLLPSPSIAAKFAGKRKDSARRVYEAYKTAGGIALDQPSNDAMLVELQLEIKKFIEQERMLQSLVDGTEALPEAPVMAEVGDKVAKAEPEARVPNELETDEKGGKGTLKIFKAYEELAKDINQVLEKQETSVLRQKAFVESKKRIATFWKNKQLAFDCEVVDLAGGEGRYYLVFKYITDSDEDASLLTRLKSAVYIPSLDLKVEDVKPGKRFTINYTVSPSFEIPDDDTLISLSTWRRNRSQVELSEPGLGSSEISIGFNLQILRVNVVWQK
jgi:hypothetical protein